MPIPYDLLKICTLRLENLKKLLNFDANRLFYRTGLITAKYLQYSFLKILVYCIKSKV